MEYSPYTLRLKSPTVREMYELELQQLLSVTTCVYYVISLLYCISLGIYAIYNKHNVAEIAGCFCLVTVLTACIVLTIVQKDRAFVRWKSKLLLWMVAIGIAYRTCIGNASATESDTALIIAYGCTAIIFFPVSYLCIIIPECVLQALSIYSVLWKQSRTRLFPQLLTYFTAYLFANITIYVICKHSLMRFILKQNAIESDYESKLSETKTLWTSKIIHDIGTPLAAANLAIDSLKRSFDIANSKELQVLTVSLDVLKIIRSNIISNNNKIKPDVHLRSCNLREEIVFRAVLINENFGELSSKIHFTYVVDESVPEHIRTDPEEVVIMIMNYLNNANKFTTTGSIHLYVSLINNFIKFSVSDTGCGIPERDKKYLFEAYRTLAGGKKAGTGLGLYSTKCRAEALGGVTGMMDNPRTTGCVFYFTIPYIVAISIDDSYTLSSTFSSEISDVNASRKRELSSTRSARGLSAPVENRLQKLWISRNEKLTPVNIPRHNSPVLQEVKKRRSIDVETDNVRRYNNYLSSRSILLIEDSRAICFLLESYFATLCKSITSAKDYWEAMAALELKRYDVVIIDKRLPPVDSQNGMDILQHIRRKEAESAAPWLAKVCIIFMSGALEADILQMLSKLDAQPVVKPFTAQVMYQYIVGQILKHQVVLVVDDEEITRSVMKFQLQNMGYIVDEASDGMESLELSITNCYSKIISDINMPNGNFMSFIKSYKTTRFPIAYICVVSAYGEAECECLRQGANIFFSKPITSEKMRKICTCMNAHN